MNYLHPYLYTHYKLKKRNTSIARWEDNLSMDDWPLNQSWTELLKRRKHLHTNGASDCFEDMDLEPEEIEIMAELEGYE